MFNLYLKKKKHNVGKLTKYDHALLAIFFLISRVLFFIVYVGKKKGDGRLVGNLNYPLGSSQFTACRIPF
jgi:hypothetical protein